MQGEFGLTTRTYTPRGADIERRWYLVDAEGRTLGRLATRIAHVLRGKHKPTYTPHLDMGDHIVVINAGKIRVTGNKAEQKVYYRHTGYPGGIRKTSFGQMMEKHPERILRTAVKGMLPNTPLGRRMFRKLRIYAAGEHGHEAQNPEALDL
jgi:large subunit ribosomal protein L13